MNKELTIKYTLNINDGDQATQLVLEQTNYQVLRAALHGNGASNFMVMQTPRAKDPYSAFLLRSPAELAQLFDPTFTLANSIDSEWLVDKLLKVSNTLTDRTVEAKEALDARIKNLVVVSNLTGLHAIGSDVMNQLYGYNWVVEQSANLIKKSKKWNDLLARIELVQDQLKEILPT